MAINIKFAAYASGLTGGIVSLVCAFFYYIAPTGTLKAGNYLAHGLDLTMIARQDMSFQRVIIGLIIAVILSAFIGAIFSYVYNKISGE